MGKSAVQSALRNPHSAIHGWAVAAAAIVLAAATVLVFLPARNFDFVGYDDNEHVLENPHIRDLGPENLAWMFTHFWVTSYYPVRLLSFAIDYRFWGASPEGYHLTNILLHVANVTLLFWLLLRLAAGGMRPHLAPAEGLRPADGAWQVGAAAAAAGLLALHPLVVEPVVWISGREELLMLLFALGTVHLHVSARRAAEGSAPRRRVAMLHGLAGASAAMASMANVGAAAIPLIVTAYDLAVARMRSVRRIVAGTWFLWALAGGAVALKFICASLAAPGLVHTSGVSPSAWQRAALALEWFPLNLRTVVWPADLTLLYPCLLPETFFSAESAAGIAALAATGAVLWLLRRTRALLFGLLWFVLALGQTSPLVPHPIYRADRYLYLPLAGLAVAAGAALSTLVRRGLAGRAALALAAAVVAALGFLSTRQVPFWRDGMTLFTHCVRLTPDNSEARANLGIALIGQENYPAAAAELREALRLMPLDPVIHYHLGVAAYQQEQVQEAAGHFAETVRLNPRFAEAHHNLGIALARLRDTEGAAREFREAIRLKPELAEAHGNLGWALLRQERYGPAVEELREAIRLKPDYAEARRMLATAYALDGRIDESLREFAEAARLDPAAAAQQVNRVARLLAASALERFRNGPAAVRLAAAACRMAGAAPPEFLDTLAAAYAEAGQFERAAEVARQALDAAAAAGRTGLAEAIRSHLEAFLAGRPWREPMSL